MYLTCNRLNIYYQNVRGLRTKLDELQHSVLILEKQYGILILTEHGYIMN